MRSLVVAMCLLSARTVFSEELVREIRWPESDHLKLENLEGREARLHIYTLENPSVTQYRYAIRGQVRYEGVEGQAYLEMWSHFPQGTFFSRTLGSGPMKSLSGSCDWRPFVLPFYNKEGGPPPQKLVVNLVLPGRGTVYVGPLRLVQYGPGEDPLAAEGQWWSGRQAGLFGGLAGGFVGILGVLAGTLASMGKARGAVFAIMKSVMAAGVACLILGLVAVAIRQPYEVYYTLLMFGVICAIVPAGALRTLRKRYEELELRKMSALDLPG